MANQLIDLNNTLFAQLDRLTANGIKGEDLRAEIDRAKAVSIIAKDIIDNAKLALEAHATCRPNGAPVMLGIEHK